MTDPASLLQSVGVPLGFALLFYVDLRKQLAENTAVLARLVACIENISRENR